MLLILILRNALCLILTIVLVWISPKAYPDVESCMQMFDLDGATT